MYKPYTNLISIIERSLKLFANSHNLSQKMHILTIMLLFRIAGQTSNLVAFQVGDPLDDYKAKVVIRVSDVFGDYAEVTYSVVVCKS